MKKTIYFGLGILLATAACSIPPALAASFDCAKAQTRVEKFVCNDSFISNLDSQLGKVYDEDIAKANPEQKARLVAEQRHWMSFTRAACTTQTCFKHAYQQRLAELETFYTPHSPMSAKAPDKILGHYVAQRVPLNAGVFVPLAAVCKTLVANFNEFRDVPFESDQPRFSPKYPQFRSVWKPMAWNLKLAEKIYVGCTNEACVKRLKMESAWNFWLKYTEPLREAGEPLLWSAQVDLLGDGRHETLIRLTHTFSPDFIQGKTVPVPPSAPYSRYFDSLIYMLPSPYPKMAKAFNNGPPGSGLGIAVTDIIQNVGDKGFPYLVLAWSRGQSGMGVSSFEVSQGPFPYDFDPLCNIRWIPSWK